MNESNADAFGIKGFNHESITRSNKNGGGVSIFRNENLSYKNRPDLTIMTNSTEMLWIEIDGASLNSKVNYLIGVIYRIPGTDISEFNSILNETLTKIDLEKNFAYTLVTTTLTSSILIPTYRLTNSLI